MATFQAAQWLPEWLAAARGTAMLATDASDTAKPLFEARGYQATRRNTIEIDGEFLGNTRMTKALALKAAADGRP
jgi:putative acetyltransferase